MTDKTLEKLLLWSDHGSRAITISAEFGGSIVVRAVRKKLHGYGDNAHGGSSEVATDINITVRASGPTMQGLDKAINDAMNECDAALARWPR